MATIPDNQDVASYFCTKHSWRGKYKRIFSIGTKGITTYNPASLEVTNQWAYKEFGGIYPNLKTQGSNEFMIILRKFGKKNETMRFSTEHRTDLLTEALRFRSDFGEGEIQPKKFNTFKMHWSESRVSVILQVTPCSIEQVDPVSRKVLTCYYYKDTEGFSLVSNLPGGFVITHGGFSRMHMFVSEFRDDIIKTIQEYSLNYVGMTLKCKKDAIIRDHYILNRFGEYSSDEHITSMVEFTVSKISPRTQDPVKRLLALSETCIIERDPATYTVVTVKPLCDIFSIIRNIQNPQLFSIEFIRGFHRDYMSTDRDALLATLLDGVRASGNRDVSVKMKPTERGLRFSPLYIPVDEEVESQHLKFISVPPDNKLFEAVSRFNSNISYSGLLHAVTADTLFAENKERLIHSALSALINDGDQSVISSIELEEQFQAIRRLVASKAGFMAFTQLPRFREKIGIKIVKALKRNDDGVTHSALDMLAALMQPMHDDYELRQEQLNKTSLLSSKKFLESLLDIFNTHVVRGTGALVISALLDFLTFALCPPYSETTEGNLFDTLLEMVAALGRVVFKLFQHPSTAIVKGAGLVMKAIIEEGDSEISAKMQKLALAEGALPRHLHTAMFTMSSDNRMLTNRQLSRQLVSLWVTGNSEVIQLLKRIIPAGLLSYLDSDQKVPDVQVEHLITRDVLKVAVDQSDKAQRNQYVREVEHFLLHWRAKMTKERNKDNDIMGAQKPIVLRKRRQRGRTESNWPLFFYMIDQDHAKSNLIWNHKTREELKDCLEAELRSFNMDKDLGCYQMISWNYQEFEVPYECLSDEIKIGDYYLRLLLEEEDNDVTTSIKRSFVFFNDLYHRFLLTTKTSMRCMCLQAMAIVYGRCHEEIGQFNDAKYIVAMLERCTDRTERDRLILFLSKLLLNQRNVKEIVNSGGIRVLVELITMAHLHTNRATVPLQTNLIEAAPDKNGSTSGEKEWYYGNAEKEKYGPYSFDEMCEFWTDGCINSKTRCWAQGMDGWRPLHSIPQLKWCLMATGTAVMNESDLAIAILNMLNCTCDYYPSVDSDGAVIRPLPKAKRLISEPACLPHIVQLLLTFEPVIVEKVAILLSKIMADNPQLPRLYLTGVFFFIMMYTGSNVLPIGHILKYTHIKQAFRSEEVKSGDVMQRSILGSLLPEAMVHYLENHGAEKFAQTFLGEFDTPEAIWNNEMRRMMILKIATHIADFSPRLRSNTRALYQYCPIPRINYPQLDNELFVNIYYLRHLCDTQTFPNWPIMDPVKLLKDILDEWKKEVEKKPPSMSQDDAYEVLNLTPKPEGFTEQEIRRAYFSMAQKYHPDKNPEGRDMFEKVNKAYEFLCTKSRVCEGPDPQNIVLILRAQSILFNRYREELQPYKYAGYPMLIKTIRMQTEDDTLFSSPVPLLPAAAELCYHTVNCSSLNAEELRREEGIDALQEAFCRCVAVLNRSSKPTDMPTEVCVNVCKCYTVSAQFGACREKITNIPTIIKDMCRILYYKNLSSLCCSAVQCISALCVDIDLQSHLRVSGVIWHLMLFLFNYDYTLEEGGVDKDDNSNQQEVNNNLARLSIYALARLGGYLTEDVRTPDNREVQDCLNALMTPYLARQLSQNEQHELLKILNSNTENPYLIWDNATRAELTEYLEKQQTDIIRTGTCDPSYGKSFVFSIHEKELQIGEIFVRVYNEQPSFPLADPPAFTEELLDYLGSQAQYLHSMMQLQAKDVDRKKASERLVKVQMALEALRNVIKNNSGVETKCITHFKLLFSLLRLHGAAAVQQLGLEVISSVSVNKDCVTSIGDSDVLPYLLLVIESLPSGRLLVIETLHALASNTKIVKDALSKGALIYLLNLFCNSTNPHVRGQTAVLLSKMMADKLTGPKVRIILSKFLPPIFMDAMRDNPEHSVHMFEGTQENPELIWGDESREKVCDTTKKLKNQFCRRQIESIDATWRLPDQMSTVYTETRGELEIGGVYLRLFIAQPAWVLRRPKDFLVAIMDNYTDLASLNPDNEILETVCTAIVALFSAQPQLLDTIPSLGHIPSILKAMCSKNDAISKSAVRIVHQFSENEACVRTMASADCIASHIVAMKKRTDNIPLSCESLHKIFQKGNEQMVAQAIQTGLLPYLLTLLDTGLNLVPNGSAVKAQIVKAVKAMSNSLAHGDEVAEIIDQSRVWAEYKDQRHDLFINETNKTQYLTGPGFAGYLTQGATQQMPDVPPPMEPRNEDLFNS